MLNNFCFHVYAQKSLFIAENCNGFFLTSMVFFDKTFHLRFFGDQLSTLSTDIRVHRAGSQLKMLNHKKKNPRPKRKELRVQPSTPTSLFSSVFTKRGKTLVMTFGNFRLTNGCLSGYFFSPHRVIHGMHEPLDSISSHFSILPL